MNKILFAAVVAMVVTPTGVLAQKYTFSESATDDRIFSVQIRMEVDGALETSLGNGKSVNLALDANSRFQYQERRLPGAGRDALALRALRYYDSAEATIQVAEQESSSQLRPERRFIVAEGNRAGVRNFSPGGSLTYDEAELLDLPGDSLALIALLPNVPVKIEETWSPSSWVAQMLTGTEAALKTELTCQLKSVRNDVATISFQGAVEGATDGAATEVTVSGEMEYHLKENYIQRAEITQKEKRSVGAVSAGMDVTAKVVCTRRPMTSKTKLTDAIAEQIPISVDPKSYFLSFRSPWNIQFRYDRNWHIFHQSNKMCVLRLLDRGSLIAQCNANKIASVPPGDHTAEEQFQADIERALDDQFGKIVEAESLKTDDGDRLYRVIVEGEANEIEMNWIYYLCTSPGGQQISFVFAAEKSLRERLGQRDLELVRTVEFLTKPRQPTEANRDP